MFFCIEIFNCFIIEKRVNSTGGGFFICLVHAPPELHPPFGQHQRIGGINHHRKYRDRRIPEAEDRPHDHCNEDQLDHQRDDLKNSEGQQKFHPLCTTFNGPGQTACLPVEMKFKTERMQIIKGLQRRTVHGPLGNAGKDIFTALIKDLLADTCQRITPEQPPHDGDVKSARSGRDMIHRPAISQRRRDNSNTGQPDQRCSDNDAPDDIDITGSHHV